MIKDRRLRRLDTRGAGSEGHLQGPVRSGGWSDRPRMRWVDNIKQEAFFLGVRDWPDYDLGSRLVENFGGGCRASGPVVTAK